ncbi:hypothetical protein WME98_44015 [Sorangium sp. So ce296]
MVLGLSALYLRFGRLPWMQGAFYGVLVAAGVVGLLLKGALRT